MKYVKAGGLAMAMALTLASSSALAQGGPSGVWEITIDMPQGANAATLTLRQDGDRLTGELVSALGSAPVAGTFAAGAVALEANIDIPGSSLRVAINGKVETDALNGSVRVGDFGEILFVGRRAAPGAAPDAGPAPVAPAAPVAESGATGKWDVVLRIAGAEFPVTANLKQDGNAVAGTLISVLGESAVSGTMTGARLTLEFTTQTPLGPIPITMIGELGAEGFSGTASLAGMGEAGWKGTRGK